MRHGPAGLGTDVDRLLAGKAGIDGMMRGLAIEAGRYGVTVNSVAPGWIVTGSSLPDEVIAGRSTPLGRPADRTRSPT